MNAIATIDINALVLMPENVKSLSEIRPTIEHWIEINKATVFDYRDKAGNKAARSHVAMLRKAKAPIDGAHKRLTADMKAAKDAIDKDRREMINMVEEMIEYHAGPLGLIEAEEKEAARIEGIRIEIEHVWDHAHELNDLFNQQEEVALIAAEQAKVAEAQAAAQREIERKQQEDERVKQAAESARLQAEAKAEKDKQDAIERERQAAEASAKALKDAEEKAAREKSELEAQIVREREAAAEKVKAEEDRKAAAIAKAEADLENVKRVNRAILAVMVGLGLDEELSKTFIVGASKGLVPAISIDYQWQSHE